MRKLFNAVDAHCQGQHGRVVLGGLGELAPQGRTAVERMRWFEQHADGFRRLMLREPRGYPRACVNLVLPPIDPRADAAFIIMEQQQQYPAMSGTNTVVVATVLLETGVLLMREPVTELTLEAPAGLVHIKAHCEGGRVKLVEFANVPSFATQLDVVVDVPVLGSVSLDIAYGGMAYAIVDVDSLGIAVEPGQGKRLQDAAMRITAAAREAFQFRHPELPAIAGIEGAVLYSPPGAGRVNHRQTTCLSTGQMDPTPAGTGASAFIASRFARGLLAPGDAITIEGMFGNPYHCRVGDALRVGPYGAVVPHIGARAWISAHCQYVLEDDDPFPEGFMMADLWPMAEEGSPAQRIGLAQRRAD